MSVQADPILMRASPSHLRRILWDSARLLAQRESSLAAKRELADIMRCLPRDARETLDGIARRVALESGITLEEIRSKVRIYRFTRPRTKAYAEALEAGHASAKIGRYFGCDHSTVLKGAARHRIRAEGSQ